MRTSLRGNSMKVLASVVLLSGAAGVAGLGTFGAFTATTTASQQVTAGTVTMTNGTGPKDFAVAVTGMVPGDSIQRSVTLVRGVNSETFGSIKLTAAGTTSNFLTSDGTNGLQLVVERCTVPWSTSGNALTCSGATSTQIASKQVVTAPTDLTGALTDLNSGSRTAYLALKLTLPAAADNTFQGLSNTINFTFDATQRAATNL